MPSVTAPPSATTQHPPTARHPSHQSTPLEPTGIWRKRLRTAHVRVTSQRLAVLSTLDAHPHSTAGEIVQAVDGRGCEALTPQGAYAMLEQLHAAGLVRRVSLPDSPSARWETRVGDNHHHVQCVVCGRVEDVDCVLGEAPCLSPSQTHGMRIIEAQITFRGVCESCARKIGISNQSEALAWAAAQRI